MIIIDVIMIRQYNSNILGGGAGVLGIGTPKNGCFIFKNDDYYYDWINWGTLILRNQHMGLSTMVIHPTIPQMVILKRKPTGNGGISFNCGYIRRL